MAPELRIAGINIQNAGGQAKPNPVRQVLQAIEKRENGDER